MRRVRTSTWILTAIFLVVLVTYVLVKPAPPATAGNPSTPGQSSPSPSPSLTRAGPDDGTANYHADGNPEGQPDEFGVPDRHTTRGPLADGYAVCGSDANCLSRRFGVTLAGPRSLSCC